MSEVLETNLENEENMSSLENLRCDYCDFIGRSEGGV